MELWYPKAIRKPLTGPAYSSRRGEKIIGFVPHVQVGRNSLHAYFSNTKNQVSSHLWVSYKGVLEQYITFDLAAWTQAAGNRAWVTCECEGFPNEPYTDEQLNVLAEFFSWGYKNFGWQMQITNSPNRGGLGTHGMGGKDWGNHPDCPGVLRSEQRGEIIRRALVNGIPAAERIEGTPAPMALTDKDKEWLLSPAFMFAVFHGTWQYPSPEQEVEDPKTVHDALKFLMDKLAKIEAQLNEILNKDDGK